MSTEEELEGQDIEESLDGDFVPVSFGEVEYDELEDEAAEEQQAPPMTLPNGSGALPPWMDEPPQWNSHRTVNPLVALHNEIVDFCDLISPLPEESQERNILIERFKQLAYETFGEDKCKVEVFGSQATGLFLPTSDIDLVILFSGNNGDADTKDNKQAGDRAEEQKEMDEWDASPDSPLITLADTLRDCWRDELTYLEVIENTRVPLCKFTHKSDVSFDVCFDQETGPKAAVLMKTYLDAMPPLRPLTFVLKYFMEARAINEPYSGGVGSFMLQLMIVSFLQHRERDGYNFRRPSLYNLGCLLVEFFELYGLDFNYVTTGISTRHDGFYFPKGANNRKANFWQPNRRFAMAIENPLDTTHDVGTPSFRMQIVQRAFELAFKTLLAHLTEPRVPAPSTLAAILPPTEEMNKRAVMKQLKSLPTRQLSDDSSMDVSPRTSTPPAKRRRR